MLPCFSVKDQSVELNSNKDENHNVLCQFLKILSFVFRREKVKKNFVCRITRLGGHSRGVRNKITKAI